MATEFPWGNDINDIEGYLKWRRSSVQQARAWSNGNIAAFLNNRLNFQRGRRDTLEREDFSPWSNPEGSLYDNYTMLLSEESDMWTEEESKKIDRVIASFVSLSMDKLLECNPGHWLDKEYSPLTFLFKDIDEINLNEDERKALQTVMGRVGKNIDPNAKTFKKPQI